MKFHPVDIESKLGFDVVRSSIEGRLQTATGLDAARSESPSSHPDRVSEGLRAVSEWQRALKEGQSPGLSGLPDLTETLRDVTPAGSWIEPQGILDVVASLTLARHVAGYFASRVEQFPSLASTASELFHDAALEKSLSRVVDEQGNMRDDASPDLRRIRKQIRNQEASIRAAAERALKAARDAGYDAGEAPTVRGGRIVIPVKVEGRRKLPGSIVDTSTSGKTAFLEPEECVEYGNELRLLEGQERREVVRILIGVTDGIRAVSHAVLHSQKVLASLDLLRAKAHLANELDAVVPEIGDGTMIRIDRAVNPTLLLLRKEAAGRGIQMRPVVPLDLTLEGPDRTLVVSGPNAGGKSVAMKTVGLFAMMLSYAVPIPCREGSIVPIFDALMVVLGDDQSLENDLSTFSSHLENLKLVVERAGPKALILIDEIGAGTDPAAGEAIARAVLEYLSQQGGFTIVTTHFGGLKAFAHDTPGMVNGAMRFDPDLLEPAFVFEPGVPGSSYALEIAERAKFPRFLLEKAHEHFGGERTRIEELILTLSRARQDAEKKSAELAERLRIAHVAEEAHHAAKVRLDESRDAVLRKAHEKAEKLLEQGNRVIEQTIREIKESQAEKAKTRDARTKFEGFRREVEESKPLEPPVDSGRESALDRNAPLAPGDNVVLDGGNAIGEVLSVGGEEVVVAFELAQMNVDRRRLRRVAGPSKPKRQRMSIGEPHLHIQSRLDLRGFRVGEAISAVERYIDDAIRMGLHRVELLHGTGTGALRQALRSHLASMPDVASFEEAPIEHGGAGVTYVVLS